MEKQEVGGSNSHWPPLGTLEPLDMQISLWTGAPASLTSGVEGLWLFVWNCRHLGVGDDLRPLTPTPSEGRGGEAPLPVV